MFPDSLTAFGQTYIPKGESVLPFNMRFVRVLHECELLSALRSTPAKMPEVRPLFPNHFSRFGSGWQMLSWQMNPLLKAGNMTAVYHTTLWITNRHGFGDKDKPRRNYFENTNLDAKETIAVEALTCGGNLLRVMGEMKAKTSAGKVDCFIVETLDYRDPVPSLAWIKAHPWLITEATKLTGDGGVTRFPQGKQEDGYQPGVRHPLVANTDYQIVIEKWRVVEWRESFAPDPYKIYLPA